MTTPNPPDVWHLVFEQTPPAIRWVLGVATLGLFTLAGMLWRWQRRDVERVERQVHARMDRVESKVDEQNKLLLEIARNTRRL